MSKFGYKFLHKSFKILELNKNLILSLLITNFFNLFANQQEPKP